MVQQEEIPIGPQRRERLSWLTIHLGVVQKRGDGDVGVPEIVMHDLVVPPQVAVRTSRARIDAVYRLSPLRASPPNI